MHARHVTSVACETVQCSRRTVAAPAVPLASSKIAVSAYLRGEVAFQLPTEQQLRKFHAPQFGGCDDSGVAGLRGPMNGSTWSSFALTVIVLVCTCQPQATARALTAVNSCVVLGSASLRNCNNPACNCQGTQPGGGTCHCIGECDPTYKSCDGNQNNQASCDCSGKPRTNPPASSVAASQTTASAPAPPPAASQPNDPAPLAPSKPAAPPPAASAAASVRPTAVSTTPEQVSFSDLTGQPSSSTGVNFGTGLIGLIPGVRGAPRTTAGGVFGVPGFRVGGR